MGIDELVSVVIVAAIAWILWQLHRNRKPNQFEVSPDIMPNPHVNADRAWQASRHRRRRLAGGFYPIGYVGSFFVGEELVDELEWMEELALMSELGRSDLGEFGGEDYHSVEDRRENNEFVTEPEPEVVEEAPEAEEFVALDPEPKLELAPVPEPVVEDVGDSSSDSGDD